MVESLPSISKSLDLNFNNEGKKYAKLTSTHTPVVQLLSNWVKRTTSQDLFSKQNFRRTGKCSSVSNHLPRVLDGRKVGLSCHVYLKFSKKKKLKVSLGMRLCGIQMGKKLRHFPENQYLNISNKTIRQRPI